MFNPNNTLPTGNHSGLFFCYYLHTAKDGSSGNGEEKENVEQTALNSITCKQKTPLPFKMFVLFSTWIFRYYTKERWSYIQKESFDIQCKMAKSLHIHKHLFHEFIYQISHLCTINQKVLVLGCSWNGTTLLLLFSCSFNIYHKLKNWLCTCCKLQFINMTR